MNWGARKRNHKQKKKNPEKTCLKLFLVEMKKKGLPWVLQNQREMNELRAMFPGSSDLTLFKFKQKSVAFEERMLFLEKKYAAK